MKDLTLTLKFNQPRKSRNSKRYCCNRTPEEKIGVTLDLEPVRSELSGPA